MRKRLSVGMFILFLLHAWAYSQEYLGNNMSFFQTKAKLYQHWLDAKGMGAALKVDKIELKNNGTEIELFLSLRTSDPDTAAALWTSLESSFAMQNANTDLGTALFHTFARMMEIPPAQGNVQIYFPNLNAPGYNPCFYVWFWEEDGKVKQESRINNCKALPISVSITPLRVLTVSNTSKTSIVSREQAEVVFDKILGYAQQRYEVKKYYERYPRVEEEDRTDYMLKIAVTDLNKEVLRDEDISAWCSFVNWLGGNCNDMRRERLEFIFYYNATDEGYHLSGQLTGKFGSGVYLPRTSGYMDMDPDFEEDFLKPYLKSFQKDLKRYLETH